MKKMLILMLAITVVCTAFATEDPKLTVSQSALTGNGKNFKLYYKAPISGKVKIRITTGNGQVIFTETITKSDGFIRPYDFSNLAEGDYLLEIIDAYGTKSRQLTIGSTSRKLMAGLVRMNNSNEKVLVTIPNHELEGFTFRFLDKSGKLIHSTYNKTATDLATVFNLASVQGVSTLEILTDSGLSKVIEL